jgi:hypothetical protein
MLNKCYYSESVNRPINFHRTFVVVLRRVKKKWNNIGTCFALLGIEHNLVFSI